MNELIFYNSNLGKILWVFFFFFCQIVYSGYIFTHKVNKWDVGVRTLTTFLPIELCLWVIIHSLLFIHFS